MLSPSSAAPSKPKANVSLVLDWRFNLLIQCFDALSFSLFQTEPVGKPWAKKLKVTPSASVPLLPSLILLMIDPSVFSQLQIWQQSPAGIAVTG